MCDDVTVNILLAYLFYLLTYSCVRAPVLDTKNTHTNKCKLFSM